MTMSENWNSMLELTRRMEEVVPADYSATVLDYGHNPKYMSELEEYNAFDIITSPYGDTMAFWLNVKDGIIENICFTTNGHMNFRAAGSMTSELAKGKTLAKARQISQQDVLEALGGLPEGYCALLATDALKKAIDNYRRYLRLSGISDGYRTR